MTWESGSTDDQRLRAGYCAMGVGVTILLFAWGLAVMRGPQIGGEVAVRQEKLEPPDPNRLLPRMGAGMLVYGSLLVVVLFVSIIAWMRLSRGFRRRLFQRRPKPTVTSDVWQMHKVPDSPDDEEADEGPPGESSP